MFFVGIGIFAALLTTFAFLPQVFKTYKNKSVKDLSSITLFQFCLGVLLWMIYGLYRNDLIIIWANAVSLVILLVLIFLYFFYKNRNRRQ